MPIISHVLVPFLLGLPSKQHRKNNKTWISSDVFMFSPKKMYGFLRIFPKKYGFFWGFSDISGAFQVPFPTGAPRTSVSLVKLLTFVSMVVRVLWAACERKRKTTMHVYIYIYMYIIYIAIECIDLGLHFGIRTGDVLHQAARVRERDRFTLS